MKSRTAFVTLLLMEVFRGTVLGLGTKSGSECDHISSLQSSHIARHAHRSRPPTAPRSPRQQVDVFPLSIATTSSDSRGRGRSVRSGSPTPSRQIPGGRSGTEQAEGVRVAVATTTTRYSTHPGRSYTFFAGRSRR